MDVTIFIVLYNATRVSIGNRWRGITTDINPGTAGLNRYVKQGKLNFMARSKSAFDQLSRGVKLTALGVTLVLAVAGCSRTLSDPALVLLLPEEGAEWLRFAEPVDLRPRGPMRVATIFRKRFKVDVAPSEAVLVLRAMKVAYVRLDGHLVFTSSSNLEAWKTRYHVDIGGAISPGVHELSITVLNRNGPAAVLAYCKTLKLFSGQDWEASRDQRIWTPAISVDKPWPAPISRRFPRTDKALVSQIHLLLPVFFIVFFWTLVWHLVGERCAWMGQIKPNASRIRWLLLAAWGVLAANNIGEFPLLAGFDVTGHMEYIRYVAETGLIPLATDGWQMFQSPLYYLVSAPLYLLFSQFFEPETVVKTMRIVPLLCGAAQVEISYRALRTVFPKREDLQVIGTVIGGLLPMNIYLSQAVGNEPLAGCLSATVVVLAFKLNRCRPGSLPEWHLPVLGFVLGLALLTKVTAVLLVPPLIFLLAYVHSAGDRPVRRIASTIATVLGVALLISGWYYLRNWIELGKPFVGGWEPSHYIEWWQYPGYRTLHQLITFGEALTYPVYSAVNGFWDAIFSTFWLDGFLSSRVRYDWRPPWNYDLMLSGAWLALLPSAGILLGVLMVLRRPGRAMAHGQLFAVCCLGVYLAALLYLYLAVPIYTTAKATYTVGLTPCYAVLAATGLDILMRRPFLRALVYACVACWAVAAYLAYLVI